MEELTPSVPQASLVCAKHLLKKDPHRVNFLEFIPIYREYFSFDGSKRKVWGRF